MITPYTKLLNEQDSRKVIKHLTHIEDLIITNQWTGAKQAVSLLNGLVVYLEGHSDAPVNLRVKIDGAPSIVVGIDPDDGRFFVGTKGALSKTPKVAKSVDDVRVIYGDKPGLADTMAVVFAQLKGMDWPNILQGDVLFVPSLKKNQTLDGVECVTFKPNTILYAVPTDSALGHQLETAKVCVCFHTTYTGDHLTTMTARDGANLSALNPPSSVVLLSNEYRDLSGTATFTKSEMATLKQSLKELHSLTTRLRTNEFLKLIDQVDVLRSAFMKFQNHLVRQGRSIVLSPSTFTQTFLIFLAAQAQDARTALKTAKGMRGVDDRYTALIRAVVARKAQVQDVVDWQHKVIRIKKFILTKLNVPTDLATFYETDAGIVAGPHEGFVAVDNTGHFVKLVDRTYFSRLNMTHGRFVKPIA